jgi:glucokinase
MRENILGVDIGGTKCAVNYGYTDGGDLLPVDKIKFATTDLDSTIRGIEDALTAIMERHSLTAADTAAVGISCGGPLDSARGVVMSPPNLPGWDNIPIVEIIEQRLGIPTAIQNDANACALAEWKFGAGRGASNMVFMTFGTGLGAGLILNGQLYTGTNDNAGEVGHLRLSEFGPVGYGKAGSFEGFCSGGGIVQLARTLLAERFQMGLPVAWCKPGESDGLTAERVAREAFAGDELALEIFDTSARQLGRGLAVVIDILNPEVVVIGGIYTRCRELMEGRMMEMIRREALPLSAGVCRVEPAQLSEQIGDYAALSVAVNLLNKNRGL